MSLLDHINPDHRPDENGELPPYKETCCMKFTIDKQCRRCPFRQIENPDERDQAMHECWDKRRGTYEKGDLKIEFNNKYR